MPQSIVTTVMQCFSPSIIDQLAGSFGETRDSAKKGIAAAVLATLAGLAEMVARPGGADRLAIAAREQDPSILGNLSGMIGVSGQQSASEKGRNLLSSFLGDQAFDGISGTVAKYAGLGDGSSTRLMGLVVPVIMAVIGRHQSSQGLDAAGLGRFIEDQKGAIASAMPAGLGDRLATLGIPSTAVESIGQSAPKIAPVSSTQSGGIPSWALALGALVIIGVAGYWVWASRAPQQVAQLPEKAASVLPSVTGGSAMVGQVDVGKQVSSAFDSATKSLNGVTDAASARNSLPQLTDAVAQLDKVQAMTDQMPSDGKKALTTIASDAKPALLQNIQRVEAMPGVTTVLKPTLDKLQAKLDTFTSAPGLPQSAQAPDSRQ